MLEKDSSADVEVYLYTGGRFPRLQKTRKEKTMERLTERDENGKAWAKCDKFSSPEHQMQYGREALERLASYEDTGLEPDDISLMRKCAEEDCGSCDCDHICELAEAKKEGRLVVLPCNVGDRVFEPRRDRGIVSEFEITTIHIFKTEVIVGWTLVEGAYRSLSGFEIGELGKTVFLTREEAKAALKGGAEKWMITASGTYNKATKPRLCKD